MDLPLRSQTLCFPRFWLFGDPRADVRQTRVRTTVLQKTRPHSSLTHVGLRAPPSQNLGKHSIWLRGGRSKSESHSSLAAALPDRTRQTLRTKRFRASGEGPALETSRNTTFRSPRALLTLAHLFVLGHTKLADCWRAPAARTSRKQVFCNFGRKKHLFYKVFDFPGTQNRAKTFVKQEFCDLRLPEKQAQAIDKTMKNKPKQQIKA